MSTKRLGSWILILAASLMPFSVVCADRPNIVFILADDLGYGDLSCNGNPIVKTPHIDRLSTEGVRFSDFQVCPLCSPTRCALMTGKHEYRSGVHATRGPGQNMDLKAITIAQVLKSAGYSTGLFGKWHLGADEPYRPYKRGFDMTLSFSTGMIGEGEPNGMALFDSVFWRNGVNEKTKGFCTDVFFDEAMKWMGHVKGKRPFFAYIPSNAPHTPLGCPPEFEKPYQGVAPSETLATYYGMIANLDANVGRLLDQLTAWGLEKNTLVVFMSDNGANPHFKKGPSPPSVYNAGMKGAKGSIDEGGTRVPSYWRLPAVFAGGMEVDRLAAGIDVFPTFAELAGAKIPTDLTLDGRSLVPLLKDPKAEWPDRLVFIHAANWGGNPADHRATGFAVRSDGFRLIGYKALFDIRADRGETKNVSAEHADRITQMSNAYDAWWQEVEPALIAAGESNSGDFGDDAEKPKNKKK